MNPIDWAMFLVAGIVGYVHTAHTSDRPWYHGSAAWGIVALWSALVLLHIVH